MANPDQDSLRKERFKARRSVLHESALHARLKQHLPAAFNERWTRRHWIHASLFATIGMLAATIIPGFSSPSGEHGSAQHARVPLTLPPLSAIDGNAEHWQTVQVRAGQTLGALFSELNLPATVMHRILQNEHAKVAFQRLRPGMEIAFDIPTEGLLRGMRFIRDDAHRVELRVDDQQIDATLTARETTTRISEASGEIRHSLYASASRAGLSPSSIAVLTDDIFKYDIDFKDVQPGDRFDVVYEESWREGERVDGAKVLAATFTTAGKTYTGLRYERNGKAEYFDADGRPLKKSFIRSPIQFARLSSNFGTRRHPILGTMRTHKGVDYAASTGTPIMAAGDARVQFAGTQRGYGNVVILDHGRGHTTLYAHMSRFGKYRTGQRVSQGQVIGYVGTTGMSTGPHLHYEFRLNGVHRNPLSVTMPPPEPLRGSDLAAFRAATAPTLARIHDRQAVDTRLADGASRQSPASRKDNS